MQEEEDDKEELEQNRLGKHTILFAGPTPPADEVLPLTEVLLHREEEETALVFRSPGGARDRII